MRKVLFIVLFGMLVLAVAAQNVEPYGEMAKPVTMVFNVEATNLVGKIIQSLGELEGVEIDKKTGEPKFEIEKWNSNFPQTSWMATNAAQMDLESIKVWWTPPKPPPQKVSAGGGDIKPLRSEIWLVVGCLKTNNQASVVRIRREWTYNARNHFPYTEIPLWRSDSANSGSYPSDRKWLHQFLQEGASSTEYDDVVYSSKILEILKGLPSK